VGVANVHLGSQGVAVGPMAYCTFCGVSIVLYAPVLHDLGLGVSDESAVEAVELAIPSHDIILALVQLWSSTAALRATTTFGLIRGS
jgi:hypothetical protein